VSTAYGPLHSLTLAVCVISTIGVSLWGRWAMFRLRKLGDGAESAALLTKVGLCSTGSIGPERRSCWSIWLIASGFFSAW